MVGGFDHVKTHEIEGSKLAEIDLRGKITRPGAVVPRDGGTRGEEMGKSGREEV